MVTNTKVTLTNNDSGPRYVFTARGMEVVPAGQSLDTEMSDTLLESLSEEHVVGTDDVPRWSVERLKGDMQDAGDRGQSLAGLTVKQLQSIANAEGVALTGRKDPTSGADLPNLTKAEEIAAAIEASRTAA